MNYRLLGILCVMFSLSLHAQGQLLSTDDSEVFLAQDMAARKIASRKQHPGWGLWGTIRHNK